MFNITPFEARTLSWWYSRRDQIDINPPYQRKAGLWSVRDKAFLIDSILNDYDIPKVYVADFNFGVNALQVSNHPYAIIDGKQRFEAIFEFFNGDLVLEQSFEFIDDPSLDLGGLSYGDLKKNYPSIASKFDNYNLTVMRVVTDDEAKLNELFVRLNRNRPLTGAEVRNAMRGAVPKFTRELSQHKFFTECIRFSVKRRQDFNAAGKLLLCEFRGKLVDTKKVDLDRFVEEGISAQMDELDRAAVRVEKTLTSMHDVFTNRDPVLSSAGPVPVYYWFTRRLPAKHRDHIREFLVSFLGRLKEAKAQAKAGDTDIDKRLVLYMNFDRNTNDQGSHEGRVKILFAEFEDFIGQKVQYD